MWANNIHFLGVPGVFFIFEQWPQIEISTAYVQVITFLCRDGTTISYIVYTGLKYIIFMHITNMTEAWQPLPIGKNGATFHLSLNSSEVGCSIFVATLWLCNASWWFGKNNQKHPCWIGILWMFIFNGGGGWYEVPRLVDVCLDGHSVHV